MKNIWLAFVLGSVIPMLACAEKKETTGFVEGIEYQRVLPPQPTKAEAGQVEVVELFWYGCPHCYRFEPALNAWLKNKPDNVVFLRIPAQLNPNWKIHAQAFYTAELLGVGEKMHQPLFHAMQEERLPLNDPASLQTFFAKHGVKKEDFDKVFNSFALQARLKHADNLVRRYGANSVPTVIVNGKYRTNTTIAGGSHENLIDVINYLVALESKAGS